MPKHFEVLCGLKFCKVLTKCLILLRSSNRIMANFVPFRSIGPSLSVNERTRLCGSSYSISKNSPFINLFDPYLANCYEPKSYPFFAPYLVSLDMFYSVFMKLCMELTLYMSKSTSMKFHTQNTKRCKKRENMGKMVQKSVKYESTHKDSIHQDLLTL